MHVNPVFHGVRNNNILRIEISDSKLADFSEYLKNLNLRIKTFLRMHICIIMKQMVNSQSTLLCDLSESSEFFSCHILRSQRLHKFKLKKYHFLR